jgi:tripartite-type tricarboxylate transporter receptor subunit TctC
MRKYYLLSVILVLMILSCMVSFVLASPYPDKPIQLIVGWGAGGGTDQTARGIAPYIEEELGQPFVVTNIPGGAGAIGAEEVLSKKNDGYTLLFGSETISTWPLMGITEHWYKDFETIAVCTNSVAAVTVHPSAPFETLEDFIKYAQENPNEIKMAGTGPATTGSIASAILSKALGVEVTEVNYQGSAAAVTGTLGGHVDVIMENVFGLIDHHKAGDLKILGVFANERFKPISDVPAIGEVYPETSAYLPYGAWFGLFAPKGTPEDVLDTLKNATAKALADPEWQQSIWDNYFIPIGLTGDEAEKFIDRWTSSTAWLIHDLGVAEKSPEELGIPKP